MEKISHRSNFSNLFLDKRLEKRASNISSSLLIAKTSSIHGGTKDEAEQKGFYRFLHNENVTEELLTEELTNRCTVNTIGREVLVIQDSSTFGLSGNKKNLKEDSGIGLVGNKIGLGFLGHCSLVLDANNNSMLGFSDVQLWHRADDKANNTTKLYKRQPIEEKESYKWIKASEHSKAVLKAAKSITIIEDREGDIYEQFCCIPDDKTTLLIRSRDNRNTNDGAKLHDLLNQAKAIGTYKIEVKEDVRKNKVKRIAILEVKVVKTQIKKPSILKAKEIQDSIEVYAIEAKEINYNGKDKICWRILTTRLTECIEGALWVIDRYKQRWYIEQLFRLLKKQGFDIEQSKLESGWAIRKLLILILNATLRLMQLYLAYEEEDSQNIEEVFNKEEIECLQQIEKKYIAQTSKTSNSHDNKKLAWASWIIARLGGWKGNIKQRKAGPITLKRGLEKFMAIFEGWKLAKNYN